MWRRELRSAAATNNAAALRSLAAEDDTAAQPVAMLVTLGVALRDYEEVDASVELLRAVQAKEPSDFWVNLELGRSLARSGLNVEAVGFSRAALASRPTSPGAMFDLANHLRDAGSLEECVRVFQRLSEMVPDDFEVRVSLAEIFIDQGQFDQAVIESRNAIRIIPANNRGHIVLGQAFERAGRIDDAIMAYQQAVDVMPRSPSSYPPLIGISKRQGDHASLARIRDSLIEVGLSWEVDGNIARAGDSYEQAINADPQSALAHYHRGESLLRSANLDSAADAFQTAIKLDPKHQFANDRLEQIRQMQQVSSTVDDSPAGSPGHSDAKSLAAARLSYVSNRYALSCATVQSDRVPIA